MNLDAVRRMIESLPPLTPLAVGELFILAALIYGALQFIRQAVAAQFLVWMALLGVAYFGGRWAGLTVAPELIGTLFPYLSFALIVLFQAEIRRGLSRLSRNPFGSRRMSPFEARHLFEDILMAVNRLAAQKIGALIVVERETSLRNYAESGVPLQARLTQDLLATIFQPRAPLHDGAVIIRRDRVLAAACFLPLTVNPALGSRLDLQLGTRHRAAIGITEETDAMAIVISEQTGFISLAMRGAIEMDITLEVLGQRLMEAFGQPANPAISAALSSAARTATATLVPEPSARENARHSE
ncbi:MAG: TIGR00159 family protein [Acidobacteria bacterium]|nr:TIGR00159 family protein [Acidobacteriota bacterium]